MTARRSSNETNGSDARGITRRSFLLGGGAGLAAIMLPCLGGVGDTLVYALIPRAYADEGQESQPTAEVIVLSRKEIGLQVYDVTTDDSQVPVSGAKVVITSFMEGSQKIEAVTDEKGAVVIDISGCSPVVQTGTAGACYRFEGSVTITNGDGYRICTLTKIRVDGGTALALPCCKITDPSVPYFESLSFNQWDMQYFDCTVLRCGEARSKVPITGKLHVSGYDTAQFSFWSIDDETGERSKDPLFRLNVDVSDGVADIRHEDLFLRLVPPSDALLPKDHSFEVHVEIGGVCYVFPVQLHAFDSPFPYQAGSATVVPSVSFGQIGMEHEIFTLPSSFPKVLSGSSITCIRPSFPFDFWLSPFGYLFFGIGASASMDASSADGFKNDGFHNETKLSIVQSFSEMGDRWKRNYDKYKDLRKGSDPGSTKTFGHKLCAAYGISFSVQGSIMADCNFFADPDTEKWTGQAGLIFDAYVFASAVEQLTIGPVPFFISITLSLDGRLALYAGVEAPAFNFKAISFAPSSSGIALVLTLGIALSIGLGISGFISAALRGSGSITMYVGIIEPDVVDAPGHVVISAALSADVVLQALMFKWSGKIWGESWPCVYDNWSTQVNGAFVDGTSESLSPTGFALGTAEDGSGVYSNEIPAAAASAGAEGAVVDMGSFGRIATIVTSDELLKTREFRATASSVQVEDALPGEPQDLGNGMYAIPCNVADLSLQAADGANGEDGYVYEYVGEDVDGFCALADGSFTLADDGGLNAQSEVRVASGVFSNPREKIVVYDGVAILFRIATVECSENGQTVGRSRLVAQVFDSATRRWGRPKVLDIPSGVPGIDRNELLDCDFDVCVQSDNSVDGRIYQGIYVGMVSTRRQNGDSTSFYASAAETIITVAVFNRDLRRLSSAMWRDDPGSVASGYAAVSCPRILTLRRNQKPFYVVMSYLRHTAPGVEDLFTSNSKAQCCIAVPMGASILHTSQIEVAGTTSGIEMVDAGSVSTDGEGGTLDDTEALFSLLLSSQNSKDIYTVSMTLGVKAPAEGDGSESNSADSDGLGAIDVGFTTYHNYTGQFDDMKLWPGRSALLSLENGELKAVSYNPKGADGFTSTRTVGPANIQLSSIKISDNGNVLFYAENLEGDKSLPFDEDGNPVEPEYQQRYRIFASICVDGLFSEPFPLVETVHPLDSIQNVSGGASYTFLFTSFTDVANSTADMYYLNVPIAAAATVLGVASESLFATQGEDAPFVVVLRNDGNVMLTGCRAVLHDAETGEAVAESILEFSPDNVCASVWSPDLDEVTGQEGADEPLEPKYSDETVEQARQAVGFQGPHPLADSANAGVLVPGRSAQYRAVFTIPSDWHGTKNVYVSVDNFSYVTIVSTAPDGAEASPWDYAGSHDELPRTSLDIHFADSVFDPGMSVPPVGVLSEDGVTVYPEGSDTDSGSGTGSGSGNGSGAGDGNGSDDATADGKDKIVGLSNTGDPLGLGAVGLAAGAVAAAFAAYSARRASLEKGRTCTGKGSDLRLEQDAGAFEDDPRD